MSTFHDFLNHPIETLERALHIRKQIATLEKTLKEVISPEPMSKAEIRAIAGPKRRGKRKMSPEARAKIANAQRLRWAKSKGLESAALAGPVEIAPAPTGKPKKKRKISAAHRAKLAAAAKARWAKVKKAKG